MNYAHAQSILVVSQNREKAKEYVSKLYESLDVDPIDVNLNYFEKAVGIEEVREMRKKIFLKPLKSKTKITVVEAYEGITTESQNALLKILEEPPNNTVIIIAVGSIGMILPTIISRCKVIDLADKSPELSKQESTQYLNILMSLSSSGVGDKLKLAQNIAKNNDAIITELEKMIIVARSVFLSSFWGAPLSGVTPESLKAIRDSGQVLRPRAQDRGARMTDYEMVSKYLNLLISLNKTYNVLKTTNVNPRLALENLFLNL